jgi:hypothetical protein
MPNPTLNKTMRWMEEESQTPTPVVLGEDGVYTVDWDNVHPEHIFTAMYRENKPSTPPPTQTIDQTIEYIRYLFI